MRALVTHTDDPARWMTPVSGDGVHQVAVGPIHAGVIESGHFRFHVVGERILAHGPAPLLQAPRPRARRRGPHAPSRRCAYVQRACAACAVSNTVAYAQAVEDALGLRPDRELARRADGAARARARLQPPPRHRARSAPASASRPGSMAFAALKDRAQQTERARVRPPLPVRHGRSRRAGRSRSTPLTPTTLRAPSSRELRADCAAAWRELEFAGSLQARLDGVGVLDARRRACASARSARRRAPPASARTSRSASPRLAYDGFAPAHRARAGRRRRRAASSMRAVELEASFELLDELLARPARARRAQPTATPTPARSASGASRARAARPSCAVELDGEPDRAGAPAHRLLRQLAGARARHRRQPRCPTSR